MTNFVPISNLGLMYANGCQVDPLTASTLAILPGQLRDSTNTFDIVVNNTLSVSSSIVGAGGLDTGTISASSAYAVYVISDITGANPPVGLLSLRSSNPYMPTVNGVTYSAYRLVGYMLTNNVGAFILSDILGNGNERINYWTNSLQVLNAGAATILTPVALTAGVPNIMYNANSANISCKVTLEVVFTPFANGSFTGLTNVGGATATSFFSSSFASTAQRGQLTIDAGSPGGIFTTSYINNVAGCSTTLAVSSFQYYI